MRLLLVSATPPNIALGSGTHVAAVNLQSGLEQLGHQVAVATLPPWTRHSPSATLARFLFNRLAKAPGAPVDLLCGFDMDGRRLADRVRAPYVAYLHGVIADEARFERGITRLALDWQAREEQRAARRADRVLVPSAYSARRVTELYGIAPAGIRVVPPGFDAAAWQRILDEARRHPSPKRETGPRLLCVARMYPRKNHAALLRAVALLAPKFSGLHLRIVGDGPERPRLQRIVRALHIERVVTLVGQIPRSDLAREYLACDLFCLPSLQEGFGLVFAEAMTAGKPIVALDAGAVPEVARQGENALLVPPGNDRALAEAIQSLLEDTARAAAIANRNGETASERFGIDRSARQFLESVGDLV